MPKDKALETALIKAREEFEEARTEFAGVIEGIASDLELPRFLTIEFQRFENPRDILPRLSIEFERALRIARREDAAYESYSKAFEEGRRQREDAGENTDQRGTDPSE